MQTSTIFHIRLLLTVFVLGVVATTTAVGQVPHVQLSATPLSIDETGGESTLTISLTSTPVDGANVQLGVSGTGITPADWSLSETLVQFTGSETVKTVTFSASNDFENEGDEDALIEVVAVGGALENPQQEVTITIIDDDAALPIELTKFDVIANGETLTARWETSSEDGNAGFEIESGSDGLVFETRAWIDGAGTSSAPRSYKHSFSASHQGINYVRLKQRDIDGSVTYSDVYQVEVALSEPLQLFAPYPNPASDVVTVSFVADADSQGKLELYNLTGRKVHTVQEGRYKRGALSSTDLDVSSLPAGMYFVRLSAGARVQTQALTIRH